MPDEDLKLPPLPDLFPDKLKNIDKEGCEQKQRELEQWYKKLAQVLRTV